MTPCSGDLARTLAFALSAFAAFAGSSACFTPGDEEVRGRLEQVVTSGSALSVTRVTALYGIYGAGCDGRVDGETWAVGVDGSATLAHPALSVRKNDADCMLSLSAIVSPTGEYVAGVEQSLDASFAASPTVFSSSAAEPAQILVNARLSALSFASDFGISVFLSVEPSTASATKTATRAVTYEWTTGSWTGCDTTCGAGTDSREVSCIDVTTNVTASDSMCDAAQKPANAQSCEDHSQCFEPDVTSPVLMSSTPAAGATGVAADVTLTATYDEAVAASSYVTVKRGSTLVTGTTTVGGNTITFKPTSPLRSTVTTYSVQLTAFDAAGNGTTTSFTFTTRDAAPPTLNSTYPANGDTGVPRAVNLVATANENLAAQSSITLTRSSDGATISGTTTVEGTTMVFDPSVLLQSFTAYKGVFTAFDAAGNQTTAVVQFTTGSATF